MKTSENYLLKLKLYYCNDVSIIQSAVFIEEKGFRKRSADLVWLELSGSVERPLSIRPSIYLQFKTRTWGQAAVLFQQDRLPAPVFGSISSIRWPELLLPASATHMLPTKNIYALDKLELLHIY